MADLQSAARLAETLGKQHTASRFVPGSYTFPHGERFIDAALAQLIDAWPQLSAEARKAIQDVVEIMARKANGSRQANPDATAGTFCASPDAARNSGDWDHGIDGSKGSNLPV
jgi:hypothetical protein